MTKLHKIDREKLAEALHFQREFLERIRADGSKAIGTAEIITKAAENWLTITDPGFEVSDGMYDSGSEAFNAPIGMAPANTRVCNAMRMRKAFKAMIAKAGEP